MFGRELRQVKMHPKEKHCLPTTDRTELHRGVGSWRLKLAQHPTERGRLGSDVTRFFCHLLGHASSCWCCNGAGTKHDGHPWSALHKWLEWEEMLISLERWTKCLRKKVLLKLQSVDYCLLGTE